MDSPVPSLSVTSRNYRRCRLSWYIPLICVLPSLNAAGQPSRRRHASILRLIGAPRPPAASELNFPDENNKGMLDRYQNIQREGVADRSFICHIGKSFSEFAISRLRGGRRPPAPRPGDIGRSSSSSSSSMPESNNIDDNNNNSRRTRRKSGGMAGGQRRSQSSTSSSVPPGMSPKSINKKVREAFRQVQEKLPGIRIRVEPSTKLKLRKTFHPLGATVLKLGADFNAQLGVWQFRSSWEEKVIGGTISMVGRELQLAKTWRLTLDQSKIGSREDLVTAVRFRAAVDLGTLKAYARFGFRTERISPISVYDGFTLTRCLPLDGKNERIKLEMKARFALPEPEIEYSTEASRMLVGLGDVEVNIDELNLLLDY